MKRNAIIQELHRSLSCQLRPTRLQLWAQCRSSHSSTRQRRDDFWSPTVKILAKTSELANVTTLLNAAGFVRQNYAGIYQFLPLGLRVLEKIERLIDKHMRSVGASKVSLSSISSQSLWERSGRLSHGEMFKFEDRGNTKWLLAPTHEEEITTLIHEYVTLPRDLPVRLYQIGRKYRDEQRPRGGLLRGREFIMKDLYTFDKTVEQAETTYHQVRAAYRNLFDELEVPFVEVRADSGNMGGDLSHEFHFPNPTGEDTVITCNNCNYARNEEFVPPFETSIKTITTEAAGGQLTATNLSVAACDFVSKDSTKLVRVLVPQPSDEWIPSQIRKEQINTHVLKAALGSELDVDTGVEEETARERFDQRLRSSNPSNSTIEIFYVLDKQVRLQDAEKAVFQDRQVLFPDHNIAAHLVHSTNSSDSRTDAGINLLRHQPGDSCPQCQTGKLKVQQAIEIGHTFHLGTRYSSKFGLTVPPDNPRQSRESQPFVEMGCHGIGVSRLVAAAVACLSSENQLRWPRIIAPYDVVFCVDTKRPESVSAAQNLYDTLSDGAGEKLDLLLDDRQQDVSLGWKLRDAFAIGYPVVVVLGRAVGKGMVEVRSASTGYGQEDVKLEDAAEHIRSVLRRV